VPDGPLTVSLDATAVPRDPVGAGRYTVELVDALAARDDVTLLVWSRRDDGARWQGRNRRVRPVAPRSRPLRMAWEQVRLPSLLARGAPVPAVHHGPHYTMPERARLPVVVTIHDVTFLDHPEWHERTKVPVFRHAISVAARRADALVCVSRVTADRFVQRCHPAGKVFVAPHGVDHDRFTEHPGSPGADDRVLDALGVRRPYVLFLGTIEPRKAVAPLVRAFDRVASGNPDLSLVVAGGRGWGSEDVDEAIAAAAHRDRIRRTGYVADDAVPPLLRGAAVVAYPALEEGFGLPALEALACGAPLVTTSGSAMAEAAGAAALLVRPGDVDELAEAVAAVLDGGPEAAERRRLGLEVAARHTWAASAATHVDAYRWAAGSAAGAAHRGR